MYKFNTFSALESDFNSDFKYLPMVALSSRLQQRNSQFINFNKELGNLEKEFQGFYDNLLCNTLSGPRPQIQKGTTKPKEKKVATTGSETKGKSPFVATESSTRSSNFASRSSQQPASETALFPFSPLLQQFFHAKNIGLADLDLDSFSEEAEILKANSSKSLKDNSQAMELRRQTQNGSDLQSRTIKTNIGSMSPASISVKIEKNILTISGEDKTETGFSKFHSARTLPPYISEHSMEEQIISKLVTDKGTGNKVLEITLPEAPKPAIQDSAVGGRNGSTDEVFTSDEVKIQVVSSEKNDTNVDKKEDCAEEASSKMDN